MVVITRLNQSYGHGNLHLEPRRFMEFAVALWTTRPTGYLMDRLVPPASRHFVVKHSMSQYDGFERIYSHPLNPHMLPTLMPLRSPSDILELLPPIHFISLHCVAE
jgi:hypothetical protein